MGRILVILAVGCALGGLPAIAQDKDTQAIANSLAAKLSKAGKKSVAVVDFTDLQGNVTELGRYVAEQMSVSFVLTDSGLEVIDRTHLKAIAQENKLSTSGLIDPSTARKLWQITGVEVLVTGTLTPFGDSVQLAVKALDAATAVILGASVTNIAKTKTIDDLLNRDVTSAPVRGSLSGRSDTPANSGTDSSVLAKEMDEIVFTINSCRFTGNTVVCSLQFTNKENDREMRLGGQFGGTRIIDQSGREYIVETLRLGIQECRGCAVVNKLVRDVPMSAGLRFGNISSEISMISLLEINYSMDGGGRWSTVQFRGVPLSSSARPK